MRGTETLARGEPAYVNHSWTEIRSEANELLEKVSTNTQEGQKARELLSTVIDAGEDDYYNRDVNPERDRERGPEFAVERRAKIYAKLLEIESKTPDTGETHL